MTVALSCFMRDLISSSDNYSSHMVVISDNAKIQASPSSKKHRTPRRSVSSPLHQMTRWDPPFTRHSFPHVTWPESIIDRRISRWASSSKKSSPNILLDHPSLSTETSTDGRASARRLLQPVRQASIININEEKCGAQETAFRRRSEDITITNSLPLSLRKLPY
jgi:hypothetical protein